jgi:peptidoglycan hydrolase CwlO-like protein
MVEYSELGLEELKSELKNSELEVDDLKNQRDFLGKQGGMHINASEFSRIDRDIEKYEGRIKELTGLIASKAG